MHLTIPEVALHCGPRQGTEEVSAALLKGQEAYVPAFPVITGREELLPQPRLALCVCICVLSLVCDNAHIQKN